MDLSGSDESDMSCPLCLEEMDSTDRKFQPCHCGYQICLWCWHHIMEMAKKDSLEGRCPACRSPYDKEKIVSAAPSDRDELPESGIEKKQKFGKGRSKATAGGGATANLTGPGGGSTVGPDARKHLANVRVVQRNLVYVVGMPYALSDEETLMRREYFGQYGRVLKIAVSRSSSPMSSASTTLHGATANVYVTFVREEDAVRCIQAIDGCMFEGRILRACFGTTKYCNAWLKNLVCPNPDCLYLHEVGTQEDSYTKEEMLHRYNTGLTSVSSSVGAAGAATSKHHAQYDSGCPVNRRAVNGLPPPLDGYSMSDKHSVSSFAVAASAGAVVGSSSRNTAGLSLGVLGKSSAVGSAPSGVGAVGGGILPAAASWGAKGASSAGKLILSTPKAYSATGSGLPNGHAAALTTSTNSFTNASAWPPPSGSSALYSSSPPTAAPGFGPGSAAAAAGLGRAPQHPHQHSAATGQQFKPSAAVLSGRVIQASAHSPPVFAGQGGLSSSISSLTNASGKSPYRERRHKSPPSPLRSPPPPSSAVSLVRQDSGQRAASASSRQQEGGEAPSFAAAAAAGAAVDSGARLQSRQMQVWPAPPGIPTTAMSGSHVDTEDQLPGLGHLQRLSDVVSGTAALKEGGGGTSVLAPAMPPGILAPTAGGQPGASSTGKGSTHQSRGKSRLVVLGHTGGGSSKNLLGTSGSGSSGSFPSSIDKGLAERASESSGAEQPRRSSPEASDSFSSSSNSASSNSINSISSAASSSTVQAGRGGSGGSTAGQIGSSNLCEASKGDSISKMSSSLAASPTTAPAVPTLAVPPGFGPPGLKARGSDDGASLGKSKGASAVDPERDEAEIHPSSSLGDEGLDGSATKACSTVSSSSVDDGIRVTGKDNRVDCAQESVQVSDRVLPEVGKVDSWSEGDSVSTSSMPARNRDATLADWCSSADVRSSPARTQRERQREGELPSAVTDSVIGPTFRVMGIHGPGSSNGMLMDSTRLMATEVAQQLQQQQLQITVSGLEPSKEEEWKLIEGILEMPIQPVRNGEKGVSGHIDGSTGDAQEEDAQPIWDASWLAAAAVSSSLKARSFGRVDDHAPGESNASAAAAAAALVATASASPRDPVASWLLHSLSFPSHSFGMKEQMPVSTSAAAGVSAIITRTSTTSSTVKQSRFSFARNGSGFLDHHKISLASSSVPINRNEAMDNSHQDQLTGSSMPNDRPVPAAPPGFSRKGSSSVDGVQHAAAADNVKSFGEAFSSLLPTPPGFKLPAHISSLAASGPGSSLLQASAPLSGVEPGYLGNIQSGLPAAVGGASSSMSDYTSHQGLLSTVLDGDAAAAAATAAVAAATALSDGPSALSTMWQTTGSSTSLPFGAATIDNLVSGHPGDSSFLASGFATDQSSRESGWGFADRVAGAGITWDASGAVPSNQGSEGSDGLQGFAGERGQASIVPSVASSFGLDSARQVMGGSTEGPYTAISTRTPALSALTVSLQAFPASEGVSSTILGSLLRSTSPFSVDAAFGSSDTGFRTSDVAASARSTSTWPTETATGSVASQSLPIATVSPRLGALPEGKPQGTITEADYGGDEGVAGNFATETEISAQSKLGGGSMSAGSLPETVPVAGELEPWQLLPESNAVDDVASPLVGLVGLSASVLPGYLGKSSSSRALATKDVPLSSNILLKATSRRAGGGRYGFGLEPEEDLQ